MTPVLELIKLPWFFPTLTIFSILVSFALATWIKKFTLALLLFLIFIIGSSLLFVKFIILPLSLMSAAGTRSMDHIPIGPFLGFVLSGLFTFLGALFMKLGAIPNPLALWVKSNGQLVDGTILEIGNSGLTIAVGRGGSESEADFNMNLNRTYGLSIQIEYLNPKTGKLQTATVNSIAAAHYSLFKGQKVQMKIHSGLPNTIVLL